MRMDNELLERVCEAVRKTSEFDGLAEIRRMSGMFHGADSVEEILYLADGVELSADQQRALENELASAFESAAPGVDACDYINDVTLHIEDIIREVANESIRKIHDKLNKLGDFIADLQTAIDDFEFCVDKPEELADLADKIERSELGVITDESQMTQEDFDRIFAPGSYKIIPTDTCPPTRFVDRVTSSTAQDYKKSKTTRRRAK